jgi:hypothetical protein
LHVDILIDSLDFRGTLKIISNGGKSYFRAFSLRKAWHLEQPNLCGLRVISSPAIVVLFCSNPDKTATPNINYLHIMKPILYFLCLLFTFSASGQILIQSHNDYEKSNPLFDALKFEADIIEADVFPVNEKLLVAHSRNQLDSSRTLDSMYIRPIVRLFEENNGRISADTGYRIILMIDIKEKPEMVLSILQSIINPLRQYFDRAQNQNAVQVVLSGERGPVNNWINYPAYIFMDGRPYEKYDSATLTKVALISDNYSNYTTGNGTSIHQMISDVHRQNKPVRLWGAPDNEEGWKGLLYLGVDVINTDHLKTCRTLIDHNHN